MPGGAESADAAAPCGHIGLQSASISLYSFPVVREMGVASAGTKVMVVHVGERRRPCPPRDVHLGVEYSQGCTKVLHTTPFRDLAIILRSWREQG